MSFIDDVLNKLFPKKKAGEVSKQPMVKEALHRSAEDKQRYFRWLNEQAYQSFIEGFRQAYWLKRKGEPSAFQVHLLQMPYANGFALTYDDSMKPHFQHFFDWLRDNTQNLNYRQQVADRQIFDRGNYVETKEKYYLKPPLPENLAEGQLIDQRYGNILIEQVLIDNKPSYLKLMASIYSDRLYKDALPFDELMNNLFEEK